MRTFKIIVITGILLTLSGLALLGIKSILPGMEPELGEEYKEDQIGGEEDIYGKQLKQFEGTVKVLGISIYGEGTHRLEQEDKLVSILESKKINLADFEGKEVKVRGFVRDTVEGAQKIMDVVSIDPIAEAGVRNFNEVGYEFSFSYPSDWEVKKEADKVTFSRKNGEETDTLIIVYQFENEKKSLEDWLKDRDQNLFYEEAQIKVGDSTGVRRTVKNGDQEIIKTYAKEGNNIYEIRLVSQDEVIRNQYFSIVDFFKTSFSAEEAATEESLPEEETAVTDEPETSDEEVIKPAEPEVVPGENSEVSSQTYSSLTPLTTAEINNVIEKGFSSFQGKTLGFEYPKLWYFSFLGGGKYGFTDDATYKANQEEISESTSRIIIIVGSSDLSCTEKTTKTIADTTYTVCAREAGLTKIIQRMAESLSKP